MIIQWLLLLPAAVVLVLYMESIQDMVLPLNASECFVKSNGKGRFSISNS